MHKMIKTIKEYIKRIKDYPTLKANNKILSNELTLISGNLELCEKRLIELQAKVAETSEENELEKYWNNRHPKREILYRRQETDGEYLIDVRSFFMKNFDYPKIAGSNCDSVALNCLKYVMKNIKYVSDKTVYGFNEYWAFAYQVMKRRKDDCDGGSVYLANIMLHNKIPNWRVRINCGDVKVGEKPIGHAYVTYCRESDNQWVVLDWCFQKSYQEIKNRPLHKDKRDYYGIWFSTTSEQSYGSHKYLKGIPEEFKVK